MKTIRIKNFGPIIDTGELKLSPVSVFCGNQGSGKSTIAKIVSTCSWLEKAVERGEISVRDIIRFFKKRYFAYHYLENYFKQKTYISYEGERLRIVYDNETVEIFHVGGAEEYIMPQIMYIPAERNFMVAIEHAEKVSNLPPSLVTLQNEYRKALSESKEDYQLPINGFAVHYDRQNKIAWLTDGSFKMRMHEVASGLQSVIPMIVVTDYLTKKVKQGSSHTISAEENERLQKEVNQILDDETLDENLRRALISRINKRFKNERLLNIIEEPEQNLFPSSQYGALNVLLSSYNQIDGSELLITTHSPYILNALTLAVKADKVKKMALQNEKILKKLNQVVPLNSTLSSDKLSIYQIEEGKVRKLNTYDGIPDDENFLNNFLEESNLLFNQLMDIEDEINEG